MDGHRTNGGFSWEQGRAVSRVVRAHGKLVLEKTNLEIIWFIKSLLRCLICSLSQGAQ